MFQQPGRVYVTKVKTGAVWSSCMPEQGVWKKEWAGIDQSRDTCPVGAVTQNFFPGSRKNRNRFVPGIVHG